MVLDPPSRPVALSSVKELHRLVYTWGCAGVGGCGDLWGNTVTGDFKTRYIDKEPYRGNTALCDSPNNTKRLERRV